MFTFTYKKIDFAHKLDKASYPADDYSKHMHYFNEILYFVRGEVNYTIEAESRRLREGDLLMIRAGQYHFAEVNDKVPYERYVLKFPDSILPDYLRQQLEDKSTFFGNVRQYASHFDALDSYAERFSDEDLYTLFVCEVVKLLVELNKEASHLIESGQSVVSRLVDYIDKNVQSPLYLDQLAEVFGFSRSYISTEFKKKMKISIMQYVRYKKIIAAHKLLSQGVKKSVVAETFGFQDYSTFYRSYVKVIGHAPRGE